MKTYFVIRIGNHLAVSSSDFHNRELVEAFGDEILGTIPATDLKSALETAIKMFG